jgi:hypothetical protein
MDDENKKLTATLERGSQQSKIPVTSTTAYSRKSNASLLAVGRPVRGCADYEPIKAHALDLLKNNLSHIAPSYTLDELVRTRALKNAVGAALCMARDQMKSRCFRGLRMFEQARRELCHELRELVRFSQMPVRHRGLN